MYDRIAIRSETLNGNYQALTAVVVVTEAAEVVSYDQKGSLS